MGQPTGNIPNGQAPTDQPFFQNPLGWFRDLGGMMRAQTNAAQAQDQANRVQGLLKARINQGNISPNANLQVGDVFGRASGTPTPPSASQPSGVIPTANAQTNTGSAGGTATPPDRAALQSQLDAKQAELQKLLTQNAQSGGGNTGNAGGNTTGSTGGTPGIVTPPPTTLNLAGVLPKLLENAQSNPEVNAIRQQIQDLQTQMAAATGNIGAGTNLAEFAGQQGQLQNLYSGRLNALETALQNAQQEQTIQQQGLGAVANAVAPTPANALGFYQPGTNQFTEYGGGTSGGGAAKAGAVGTQINQGAAVQNMKGTQSQAQALATNLSNLINSAGINSTNTGALNSFVHGVTQWLNNQSGDPQYQNFANLINEISSRYASILNQAGGTPTDQSTLSHAIINGLASGQDIQTVLGSLDKNATDSIDALRGASQTNALNAGSTPSNANAALPQEGDTQSAGGMNWTYKNGQWEVLKQ